MNKYKAGLHKDVSTIFNGVWDPEQENPQESTDATAAVVAYADPTGMSSHHERKRPSRFATIVKVFVAAPGHLFSSRTRREKRRLLSISRHLLINQPS